MKKIIALLILSLSLGWALPSHAGLKAVSSSGGTSAGVASINSTTGAFTFTGSGVSCTTTTCTFSGSGSLLVTDGTNSVSGVNQITFGNGILVGGSAGSATANLTVPNHTYATNHTVAATDMAGTMNLTGSATLTIPAISSTVFASGMSSCFNNQGSGTWTLSTTPTVNGMNGTSLPPGTGGCLVSNGTTLDYQPGQQPPSSTVLGGVLSIAAVSHNFLTSITTAGQPVAAQPAFSDISGTASLTTQVTGILPIANGGTATATPGLVAGTNVTITGSWPNQTINSTGGGGVSSLTGDTFFFNNSASTGAVTLTQSNHTANTVVGALTATVNSDLAVPSCSTGSSALTWTTGTGFGCNTISGSGTVNSGTANQIAYYAGTGTAVSGNANFTVTSAGVTTITGTSATLVSIGTAATNPIVNIDASAANQVSGITIKGGATGVSTSITSTDPAANSGMTLATKGTGLMIIQGGNNATNDVLLKSGGSTTINSGLDQVAITPGPVGTLTSHLFYTAPSDVTITAGNDYSNILFNNATTRQWATGTVASTEDVKMIPGTLGAVGASSFTSVSELHILGMPNGGTNATLAQTAGILVDTIALTNSTNGYGAVLNAPSGATNNYAAKLIGQTQFNGAVNYTGTAPVVSSCGTSPSIDANATNSSGSVTVGTVAAATCTVTFAGGGFTTSNHCRVTSQSTIASFAYTYNLTTITVTGTSLVGDLFDYACDGR